VVVHSHGRRDVVLVDAPCFGRPVRLVWRKRTWRCGEPACPAGVLTEQHDELARPRALLTIRACWGAIGQLRREHASVAGIARQLGTTWRTVWRSIKPLLQAMADDETRFEGVGTLGVDEHVWHHVSTKPVEDGGRGPKELTGMVDLTRDAKGKTRARLLDPGWTLVPGRSGAAYAEWLQARNQAFRDGIEVATLDPFHGYKNALDDQLEDAVTVLDAFHVVKLGTAAVDEVRRRIQQQIHGHRGRKGDPLYGIRTILRCGVEKLTDRQRARLDKAIAADERHDEVHIALAVRPATPLGLPDREPRQRPPDRREDPALVPDLPDPRDQAARQDIEAVARGVLGLLHHRTVQQRRHRSHQRTHRTPPPHSARLPQPRQLPPTHAPGRWRTHPPPPQVSRALLGAPHRRAAAWPGDG
jgi:Transposase/Helix-turn-helix domain of transposase family ISL3